MNRAAIILRVAALFILATVASAGDDFVPRNFKANLGSYAFGGVSEVTLESGTLTYKGVNTTPQRISPTPAQWKAFREELDALNVWRWKEIYFDRRVLDGTQWYFEIEYADKTITSRGSNQWPDGDGVGRPTEEEHQRNIDAVVAGKPRIEILSTESFDRLISAIEGLLGGKTMR